MNRLMAIKELLLKVMRTAYDAETLLYQNLSEVDASLLSNEVREFIGLELKRKRTHKVRLEAAFAILHEEAAGAEDDLVRELTNFKKQLAVKIGVSGDSDDILIMISQVIRTHLINAYQVAVTCASVLGYMHVARILRKALISEKQLLRKLDHVQHFRAQMGKEIKTVDE
ncbi:MAG TPA: DUF892 family protein [Chryseosolibacter sp.]|nr:DUF892 family protein [Chryseosolibacter sp.]